MTQLNRHEFPNGGWFFRQPQTNWVNPMKLVGFDASVKAIINHRKANKAIAIKHSLSTDYDDVASELETYTRKRLGIPDPNPPSFFWRVRNNPSLKDAVAAAKDKLVGSFRKSATGIATLADWLGEKPVSQELAENRASICIGCPQNRSGDLLSFFTKPASDLIRKQLQERMKLNLSTSKDADLGICYACGCPLKLKIHVPIDYIRAHIKKPEFDALDQRCWMRHE